MIERLLLCKHYLLQSHIYTASLYHNSKLSQDFGWPQIIGLFIFATALELQAVFGNSTPKTHKLGRRINPTDCHLSQPLSN